MSTEDWRERLARAVAEKAKSKRAISLAAGLGAGYVHSILSEGKDPTVQNLMSVCDQLGVSLWYILYGQELTSEDEELLRLFQSSSPAERAGLLQFLRGRNGS